MRRTFGTALCAGGLWFAGVIALAIATAAGTAYAAGPPDWFVEDVTYLTAESGHWVTSNADYQSDDEPFDHYVMDWIAGPANASMSGRLYGVKDGAETVDFWRFSQYWDPDLGSVVVEQYGWQSVGLGTAWAENGGVSMLQTFTAFDGQTLKTGHRAAYLSDTEYETASFSVDGDTWTPQRRYVWTRQSEQR